MWKIILLILSLSINIFLYSEKILKINKKEFKIEINSSDKLIVYSTLMLTMIIAITSVYIADSSRKALASQVIDRLLDYKHSKEFLKAGYELRKWQTENKKKKKDFSNEFKKIIKLKKGKELGEYSRHYYLYFVKIYKQKKLNLLKNSIIKLFVEKKDKDMLLTVIKPLEKVKAELIQQESNNDYNWEQVFNFFDKLKLKI